MVWCTQAHLYTVEYYVILCLLHIIGSVAVHESVSVHHLPRGSTASGLQSLQDNGTQAPTCHARIRNRKHTSIALVCPVDHRGSFQCNFYRLNLTSGDIKLILALNSFLFYNRLLVLLPAMTWHTRVFKRGTTWSGRGPSIDGEGLEPIISCKRMDLLITR
jgi:hypothetical protein